MGFNPLPYAASSPLLQPQMLLVRATHDLPPFDPASLLHSGVSNSSIVELQAQLYRTQDHVQLRQAGVVDTSDKHVRRRKLDPFDASNAGVYERSERDRLQLKGTAGGPAGLGWGMRAGHSRTNGTTQPQQCAHTRLAHRWPRLPCSSPLCPP